jgi:hypothetical protein
MSFSPRLLKSPKPALRKLIEQDVNNGPQTTQLRPSRGRRWPNEIVTGKVTSLEQIATRDKCSVRQVNMTISLAFLAPWPARRSCTTCVSANRSLSHANRVSGRSFSARWERTWAKRLRLQLMSCRIGNVPKSSRQGSGTSVCRRELFCSDSGRTKAQAIRQRKKASSAIISYEGIL